jgi:transcriptional regulator with GAF, ATPase, and Fis domain
MHLLLGESETVCRLRERLQKIAGTNATVLVQGETGSGKELVARTLHEHGPRASGPFVKVDCAAMPEGLIESELFGHVKGAFTDARAHHEGKFARAHGGTLFLDEIGEMQLSVQAKLLLAIESGEIEPVGGEKTRKVDVRIVAATHRDLDKMVAEGKFRQDLLYRLMVVQVRVPPLREHPGDIAIIARHFLADFCAANGLADLELAPGAVEALSAYSWPGNVRELRNVVQRCAVESTGLLVQAGDVRQALAG